MTNDTELNTLFSASNFNDLRGDSVVRKQVLEINERYVFNRIVIRMEAESLYGFASVAKFSNKSIVV